MTIHKKSDNLWLIDLDQNLEGFRQFISCWIYQNEDITCVVDPGPASTISHIKKSLASLSVKHLDFILLTHIHIDHAGGTGLLLHDFPNAQIICHTKGIPHMVEPARLWEGSLKVLGQIAEAYGPIEPVNKTSISFKDVIQKGNTKIEIYETPGHAAHHLNFLIDGYLFAGEVAGVHVPVSNGFYLRIATPPKFIYEVYKESLIKASSLNCDNICFGHYDLRKDIKFVFDSAQQQLELWFETTSNYCSRDKSVTEEVIFNDLMIKDVLLHSFSDLDKDIQQREKYFAINSIKGMISYISSQK